MLNRQFGIKGRARRMPYMKNRCRFFQESAVPASGKAIHTLRHRVSSPPKRGRGVSFLSCCVKFSIRASLNHINTASNPSPVFDYPFLRENNFTRRLSLFQEQPHSRPFRNRLGPVPWLSEQSTDAGLASHVAGKRHSQIHRQSDL